MARNPTTRRRVAITVRCGVGFGKVSSWPSVRLTWVEGSAAGSRPHARGVVRSAAVDSLGPSGRKPRMRVRIAAWRRAMFRGRGLHAAVVLLAAAFATAATLAMIAPRLTHTFPSMIDDWYSIEHAVGQLPEALTGRNPEELRYRPAWVVWNAGQWHTLGAPTHRWGPQVWGILRVAVLALGLAALAATIVRWPADRRGRLTASSLVAGVPLVVMTMPGFAVNLARWGPQEPLQVGSMSLGAALIVWSLRAATAGSLGRGRILSLAAGIAFWWFGVLQKETSLAVVVLAPFLWPYVRRNEWRNLVRERSRLVAAVAAGVAAPLVLAAVHTVTLLSAETRVYGVGLSPRGVPGRLVDQLGDIDHTLESPLAWLIIASAFLSLLWAIGERTDWLTLGLLACALSSAAWVAQTGIFVSRYYLPVAALVVLALARSASARPRQLLVPAVVATLLADRLNGGSEGPVDWLIRQAAHDAAKLGVIVVVGALALGVALVAKVDRRALLAITVAALLLAVVAQTTNAVVAKFYPVAALIALLGLMRSSDDRSDLSARLVAVALIAVSMFNVASGRDSVDSWLQRERAQEALVRAVAAREAGGCTVRAIGKEVEFVAALPVLRRFVKEPAAGCLGRERFVAVIDGELTSGKTPPTHPVLVACAPWEVAWRSQLARILRCDVTA